MALAADLSHLPKPAKVKADAWSPDGNPRFVHLLVEQWAAEDAAAGSKPRAFEDARFRHSDAGSCARKIALAALNVPPSNPMDLTGTWNTRLGTMIHEAWQDALQARYPDALVEPKMRSVNGQGAGHADAFIVTMEVDDAPEDSDAGGTLGREGAQDPGRLLGVDGGEGVARLRGDRGSVPESQDAAGSPSVVGDPPRVDPDWPGDRSLVPESWLREPGSSGAGDPSGEHPSGGRSSDALPEGSSLHGGEHATPSEPSGARVSSLQGRRTHKILFELKTIGGFGFKCAVGERGAAQGPKFEHVAQTALNAKGMGADEIVIGYLSKEAMSVAVAARKGFSELGRFCAEWSMPADEFLPIAAAEEQRVAGILELLDGGELAARKIPSPELPRGAVIVDPAVGRWEVRDGDGLTDTGTFWACGYCNYQDMCVGMESGRQSIPVELNARPNLKVVK